MFGNLFNNYEEKNIGGLTDELKAIYISNYFEKNNKNILFVCNSLYEANKAYQSIKNYTSDVLFFPMDDFMTSEVLAISPDFKMTRLETLCNLNKNKIIVTNLMGYLRFLPKKQLFFNKFINLKLNDEVNLKDLVEKLYSIGYERQTVVNKTGEMAIRGYVIDIFPINFEMPVRIEFWGDNIDSIRKFDIDSQLTKEKLESITITPNTEFLTENNIDNSLPHRLLCENTEVTNIRDYLDNSILIYNDYDDLKISYENLLKEIVDYCLSAGLKLDTKFFNDFLSLEKEPYISLYNKDILNFEGTNYISYKIEDKFTNKEITESILTNYLKKYKSVVICVTNRNQVNKIIDNIDMKDIIFTDLDKIEDKKINLVIANITDGFIYNNIVYISENEIFNKTERHLTYKTNFKYGTRIKDINKLEIGDFIVHNTHGIGRYCGIKTINKNGLNKDYLHLEYQGGDKLYIPVEKIDFISKYSSKEGYEPKINKLGTGEWEKAKLRARTRAKDIAKELLKVFALRKLNKGYSFSPDDENQIAFEKEFPYQDTIDQIKVTEEIKRDMESPYPMDRLLCGDVGYGKTEIAFRAAFKAILSGKQVALLCPTTILSNQHFLNARERFKSFPVNIKLLNRFITVKNTNETIKNLKDGKVDFVIGTHKLLNDKVEFKDLGLLIIDEEQRFGVTDKEKIKKLRTNVDVLTLSATPIPRTLQMSLSGIRGLSTIETPPSNRYPVQTYVLSYNKKVVKDAIYKELSRSGQAFILYNHIDDMSSKLKEISELVPDAKIVCAHGRMSKIELEDIMLKFTNKEFDVLLCTTIIETGIDIPNVNTLIVMDADKFGLSQLYQLRGRVGRTNRLAYCYLMYDQTKILSEIAKKRLNAIKEFTELGSGLSIAMRDLAIRGSGDILGSEQAGFIDSVGIELFSKMLKQEIDKLTGEYVDEEEKETQPLIEIDTSIDNNYVEEESLKIEIHKKINEIDSYEKLVSVKEQLEDRFGKLSENLIVYMHEEWFEAMALKLGIKMIKQKATSIDVILDKEITDKLDGESLFINTFKISNNFRFSTMGRNLVITLNLKGLEKHFIYYLIDLMFVIKKAI